MSEKQVSASVIRRLPRYYRFLGMLAENGVQRISSGELSSKMGLTASQIRQDLNCFGGFGQQGYGYNVSALREEIGKILGLSLPKKGSLLWESLTGTKTFPAKCWKESRSGTPTSWSSFAKRKNRRLPFCACPKWRHRIWFAVW